MPSFPENPSTREERLNEIIADYLEAVAVGQSPDRQALLAKHPDLATELKAFFADQERFQKAAGQLAPAAPLPCQANVQGDASGAQAQTVAPGETLPDPSLGTVRYFGDYELLEKIAEGGMGVVYRARQVSLNRTVALKMIRAGQFAGDDDVQRFQAEARMAAQLCHPNIVNIYEIGEDHGQHYFAMEYIAGRDLASLIRDNLLPPRKAAAYVRTVAEAIAYAHSQKTLHRDLKPSNILIDAADQPHVTDFGLAKRLGEQSGLTVTGQIVGTPSYMSPEQASGRSAEIGPSSDVYSLGAVLYELVTGRPPFKAATVMDTLVQVCATEPVSPRLLNLQVPRDIEAICLKCLAKDPRKRYGSAKELADDLGRFLAGEPTHARPSFIPLWAQAWFRQNLRATLYTTLAGILGGLLLSLTTLPVQQLFYSSAESVYMYFFPSLDRPRPLLEVPDTGPRMLSLEPVISVSEPIVILMTVSLVLWLVRPTRRGGQIAAGATAGLVLIFTFFALSGGWEFFADDSMQTVRSDLEILAGWETPEGEPDFPASFLSQPFRGSFQEHRRPDLKEHSRRAREIAEAYSDLKDVSADEREPRLASKVLVDLPLRMTVTIRLRMLGALEIVLACVLCTLILGRRLRKGRRSWAPLLFALTAFVFLGWGIILLWPMKDGGLFISILLIQVLLLLGCGVVMSIEGLPIIFRTRWTALLGLLAVCTIGISKWVSWSWPDLQGRWVMLLIEGIASLALLPALLFSLMTESEEDAGLTTMVTR
jgi:serine/threonine protein kinase